MMAIINKLMWIACALISVAFLALSFIVVGKHQKWLAIGVTIIGASIMVTTLGTMCYWEEWRHEIAVEINKLGRVSSIDLADVTGVDLYHVEKQAQRVVSDNPGFMLIQGEIMVLGFTVPTNLSVLWGTLQHLLHEIDGASGVAVESSFFKSIFNGLVKEGESFLNMQLDEKALDLFEDNQSVSVILHRHLLRTTGAHIEDMLFHNLVGLLHNPVWLTIDLVLVK
ncbi:hypothetical protein GH714_003765 [Hevea brasiliensis]|uniref:Uncharacterized protein n=1 Tax=Hevea brasiliensis TaxID=3981 RepID=A0A6A6K5B5_HEVBR|nr:hypothetical protein GH714_003765 [Hevea brasiliensis]